MRTLTVLEPGPLTTVQDTGRPGQASVGVGRSGACDRSSAALANRLVGNAPDDAVLEVTSGGLVVQADAEVVVVTTGARCRGSGAHNAPVVLRAGSRFALAAPVSGLRTYVAVRGGIDVPPVLGSRSTDLLARLGPRPLAAGDVLPVGEPRAPLPDVDVAAVADPVAGTLQVRLLPGPRRDWFAGKAWDGLVTSSYAVTSESNRIGLRLDGPPLERRRAGELASEGMARGALQVPPSGQPVLLLADHPVTGGYPVIGYVHDDDVDACGQIAAGSFIRFRAGSA